VHQRTHRGKKKKGVASTHGVPALIKLKTERESTRLRGQVKGGKKFSEVNAMGWKDGKTDLAGVGVGGGRKTFQGKQKRGKFVTWPAEAKAQYTDPEGQDRDGPKGRHKGR